MSQLPVPARTWVRFGPEPSERRSNPIRLDRYHVDKVICVKGEPIQGIEPGNVLERVEDAAPFPQAGGPLIGCTQHVLYTHQRERRELSAISASESGPIAVLIPIRKSETWWALAQDEREQLFRARAPAAGHVGIGFRYAPLIYRKLYHARYAGGGEWDFLTYFEFSEDRSADFQALLRALRNPEENPEWSYVERETEVWMTRL